MPHFTLQTSPQGPLLNAVVGISQERHVALMAANLPIPASIPIRALVDTGASVTCIDPSILQSLALSPTGNATINTPSTGNSPIDVDQYDVGLIVPPSAGNQHALILGTVAVICSELLISQGFHALIGRDILAHCLFYYNGVNGLFTIAY